MRALNAFSDLFPFSHRRLKDGPCRQRDLQRSPNGKLIFPTSDFPNLDKIMYPAVGFTKRQVIDYYIRVSPYILPHIKNLSNG